jgi:hypothetical protein
MISNKQRLTCTLGVILLTLMLGTAFAQNTARPRPSPSPAIGPAILVDSTGKRIGPFDWERPGPGTPPTGGPDLPTVLLKLNGGWVGGCKCGV